MSSIRSLIAALAVFAACDGFAQSTDGGTAITIGQLRTRGVVGELGLPLGTIATIEGRVVDGDSLRRKAYAGVLLLQVEKVNGKPLTSFVTLPARGETKLIPKAGESFALIAYETGAFTGAPDGLFEHVEAFATTGYGFEVSLNVLKRATIKAPK